MDKPRENRPNIIGAGQAGSAVTIAKDTQHIHATNSLFWDTAGSDVLGATALPFYGGFISEENRRLLGDLSQKKVLEIGCGTGHSLQYVGQRGAAELWGVDLSANQLEKASRHLAAHGLSAKLICAPMEAECGIPTNYFDLVYSVYSIGWTTDLAGTFARIASYLKKDGVFVFSWSHPVHKCVATENDTLVFKKCYFDEAWYAATLGEDTLTLCDRMLSTYINALAGAGFVIEQMLEDPDEEMVRGNESDFAKKASMLPVTFVLKARKA